MPLLSRHEFPDFTLRPGQPVVSNDEVAVLEVPCEPDARHAVAGISRWQAERLIEALQEALR